MARRRKGSKPGRGDRKERGWTAPRQKGGAGRVDEVAEAQVAVAAEVTGNVLGAIDSALKPAQPKPVVAAFYEELSATPQLLLGYVMSLGYEDGTLITNDFYKLRCGGVAKNSFLLILPHTIAEEGFSSPPPHLILARVLEPASIPLAADVSRTYFELHKAHMPEIDVFTKSELQWSAVKIAVLGTFYDHPKTAEITFGGDIESFYSPHLYAVYTPRAEMLEALVNAFVERPLSEERRIGHLRMTESQLVLPSHPIPVFVSPDDFIGSRTALFGKTRMGKSNAVKIIVRLVMDSGASVGQVIFDPNGEYAYRNEQDKTSIYDLYSDRCVRYTLREAPSTGVKTLKANFYADLALGHRIICNLYEQTQGTPPDYLKPFFEWEVLDDDDLRALKDADFGGWTRYQRQLSVYKCVLKEAGFEAPKGLQVDLHLAKGIRQATAERLDWDATPEKEPIDRAIACYACAWEFFVEDPKNKLFQSDSGRAYFDPTVGSMLTALTGTKDNGAKVSGAKKLSLFRRYHSVQASALLREMVEAVASRKTVIIDLSNAPEDLQEFFSELISKAIFNAQMERFISNALGDHFVQFYFEEAHNLFPRDDKNLRSIYNRLAKEGAKLNIGVVYSTQSIASLSPDLLKNTENFFIAHLNDENEIRALTRFYEFRDVGADIQKTKTRGFMRMITRSHKFALPVQIALFGQGE